MWWRRGKESSEGQSASMRRLPDIAIGTNRWADYTPPWPSTHMRPTAWDTGSKAYAALDADDGDNNNNNTPGIHSARVIGQVNQPAQHHTETGSTGYRCAQHAPWPRCRPATARWQRRRPIGSLPRPSRPRVLSLFCAARPVARRMDRW